MDVQQEIEALIRKLEQGIDRNNQEQLRVLAILLVVSGAIDQGTVVGLAEVIRIYAQKQVFDFRIRAQKRQN
jgi:hypothetical protein